MINREAFDAWFRLEIENTTDQYSKDYMLSNKELCHHVWQAALAQANEVKQSQAQQESQEIGEMRENGVNWYGKNPHAFALGTKFFALPPTAQKQQPTKFIQYRHKDGKVWFYQSIEDKLPSWACDVKPYIPPAPEGEKK